MMRINGGLKDGSEFRSESLFAVSPWCASALKRGFDIFGAIFLLILLSPLMVAVAVLVKLTSRGPVLFRQRRPGKNGREFTILKFRTMIDGRRHAGPAVTRPSDPSATCVGRYMRTWKLDEYPQLFNVLRGDMSFVGPRPLPTPHWEQASVQEAAPWVLSVRPGITCQATVKFRNEEDLLAPFSVGQVEDVYMKAIMPLKMRMNLEYLQDATFTNDLRILFKTMFIFFNR